MEWRLIQWVFCLFYRQDRPQVLPVTRQSTGKLPPARQYDVINNSTAGRTGVLTGKTSEEIKEKLEQQLRQQRAALVQKRALESRGKRILPFLTLLIRLTSLDLYFCTQSPSKSNGSGFWTRYISYMILISRTISCNKSS